MTLRALQMQPTDAAPATKMVVASFEQTLLGLSRLEDTGPARGPGPPPRNDPLRRLRDKLKPPAPSRK